MMQKSTRRDLFILSAIVFWILFVLGGYYYYHKPVNLAMLAAPFNALLDVIFLVLFAGLAGGLGRRLLRGESMAPLERAALQFALGCGIISLTWLILGAVGAYRFPLGAPLLVLGLALLRKDVLAWFSAFRSLAAAWQRSRTFEKVLASLCAVLVLYQLFIALAPPLKWDALAYHLQLPRQYLAAGRLVFIPENPYWGHPQLAEMLYTFAMSIHRAETAALLGWGTGVIFLVGLLGCANTQLARLRGSATGATAGWMAVTAVLAGLTFRSLMGWAYNDLFSALYGLAALSAFFEWLENRRASWFLAAALFCGLALGTKWTAGVLALAIFTAALVVDRKGSQLPMKYWLAGGLMAFLAITPWLVKNLVVTGSPLYPYIIGTPWFDSARLASANEAPQTIDWWMHLLLPFSSTWAGVDSAAGFSTDLGPLLLLFALPGYLVYRRDAGARTMAILLGFSALGLGIASLRYEHLLQTRLYYVALPALAIPCGWGWEWLQRQVLQGVRLRRILGAVALLVMGLVFWQDSFQIGQMGPVGVSLGTRSRQSYLENNLGFHILAMQKLETLPGSSNILMLWEPRGLYAPLNARADLWIDRWRTDRRELNNAAAILQRWKDNGFTHLLVYQPGIELIRPQPGQAPSANWIVLEETLALLPAPVSIGDAYLLYPLR